MKELRRAVKRIRMRDADGATQEIVAHVANAAKAAIQGMAASTVG